MKKEIRGKYKIIRNNIKNKEEKTLVIKEKLINLEKYKKSKIIAIFKSFGSEINTTEIIDHSLNNGKVVILPKVVENNLKFYKISNNEIFVKSKFGIDEPIPEEENLVQNDLIDLIIVPGLSFDKEKNRLGYGGGYYDRFLSNVNCMKIGICYEEQIYEGDLPAEKTDIKMDLIVTDKNIY